MSHLRVPVELRSSLCAALLQSWSSCGIAVVGFWSIPVPTVNLFRDLLGSLCRGRECRESGAAATLERRRSKVIANLLKPCSSSGQLSAAPLDQLRGSFGEDLWRLCAALLQNPYSPGARQLYKRSAHLGRPLWTSSRSNSVQDWSGLRRPLQRLWRSSGAAPKQPRSLSGDTVEQLWNTSAVDLKQLWKQHCSLCAFLMHLGNCSAAIVQQASLRQLLRSFGNLLESLSVLIWQELRSHIQQTSLQDRRYL